MDDDLARLRRILLNEAEIRALQDPDKRDVERHLVDITGELLDRADSNVGIYTKLSDILKNNNELQKIGAASGLEVNIVRNTLRLFSRVHGDKDDQRFIQLCKSNFPDTQGFGKTYKAYAKRILPHLDLY
jgi:hypothetical protein